MTISKTAAIATAVITTVMSMACSDRNGTVGVRTEPLDDSCWEYSEWISAADAPVITGPITITNERAADGASWFVTSLDNDREVVRARWMTSGLGVYQLYVNGRQVGEEILKPGFTHTEKTRLSFTYDVSDIFGCDKGDVNVLAAQVTPGWWADKIVTPSWQEGMTGRKVAFRGVLELEYADGSRKVFGTDCNDWKAGIAGPVRHAAIFDGEEYDARCLPGYGTPELLSVPEINNEFKGEIIPSDGAEVYLRKDLALIPQSAYTWKGVSGNDSNAHGKVIVTKEFARGERITLLPGETLVVDFGQNCAAVPEFVFKAKEGTVLTCLPGELLNDGNGAFARGMDGPEGSIHRLNLRTPDSGMILRYTFAGNRGYVRYHPQCTFFGYRYISVTATDEVSIRSISSIPVTSVTKEMQTGTLNTGNALVNRLIANTFWGQLSNYLSVPTDCPQRNERLGWTADTQVFAETGTFFANTGPFLRKWMKDMRDTQSEHGGFPGVAPKAQYGSGPREMMRIGWADAGIIVPWVVWKQFNDTAVINENWEAMEKFIGHVDDTKYRHENLVSENGDYQWADWLSYEPLESAGGGAFDTMDGRTVPKPEAIEYWNYLGASYWMIDAVMMRDMARATGRDTDRYERMISDARQYILDNFLNASDGTFRTAILNTMQTPALFALKNNLLGGKAKENMISRLLRNFEAHGNCLQTGFLGTSILMPVLTDNGMSDMAYELLFQRKNPSWMYSIDNGATTIWERWNSYTIDNGMGPRGMNSFNHYAYGCICEWMWKSMAGIASDTEAPGFRHIIMKPVPDRRLGYVKAEYRSVSGPISSEWRYEGDTWIWDFTIPEGCTASVTVPGENHSSEYASGSYRIERIMP